MEKMLINSIKRPLIENKDIGSVDLNIEEIKEIMKNVMMGKDETGLLLKKVSSFVYEIENY